MITYPGLPAPLICDFLSREASRERYAPGVEFQIGRIEMVANTGTYLDSPFHRYADGKDLAELPLESLADLDAVVIRGRRGRPRDRSRRRSPGVELGGKAVLVRTGWDAHWRTDRVPRGPPVPDRRRGRATRGRRGAALVGIDSLNIDDTADLRRPVHSTLLGAGIPIVEHLCGLWTSCPTRASGSRRCRPRSSGSGQPVRAFAHVVARHSDTGISPAVPFRQTTVSGFPAIALRSDEARGRRHSRRSA